MMQLPFVSRKKYDEVVYKLGCLLCHATGGKLSKHTYPLRVMESVVTDYIQESCDEAIEDYKKYAETVHCKDCEYLMFSDCYGECSKAYKGIVSPDDSCGRGKKRNKEGAE